MNGPSPIQQLLDRGAARSVARRQVVDRLFVLGCLSITGVALLVLAVLLAAIVVQGRHFLDADFLTTLPSRKPEQSGIKVALWGSVWLVVVCAAFSLPIGVATAVFMEEFKPKRKALRRVHGFLQLNIANLAGVPSIVYGIIGLTVFANAFGLLGPPGDAVYDEHQLLTLRTGEVIEGRPIEYGNGTITLRHPIAGDRRVALEDVQLEKAVAVRAHRFTLNDGRELSGTLRSSDNGRLELITPDMEVVEFAAADVAEGGYRTENRFRIGNPGSFFFLQLPLGSSVLAGGLTLMLVILPIVIISTREALRAVPDSLRQGSLALGATRWQTVWGMVLPSAVPGIMTGSILALGRAIGEAAPLLVVGGFLMVNAPPRNLMDDFAAMPLQIYNWAGRPQEDFMKVAASGIIVLLGVLLAFNAVAIVIRQKFQKPLQ